MKLSIIVPVYNVADYLAKCLDSLLAQDLPQNEYEIIVVNDGSTDDSGVIAQQYADKYSNITLINQANQGLSGARNTGIKHSKGNYIQFVDSDDYLEVNVLGTLMNQIYKEDLDVLRFDYQNVRISDKQYEVFQPYKFPHQVDTLHNVVDGETYMNERMGYACYACQFVIRHELTGTFKPGIYFEDTEWLPRMLLSAKRVNSSPLIVYNYLMREGSITNAVNIEKQRKVLEDKIKLVDSLLETQKTIANKIWFEGMIAATVLSIIGCIAADFYDERKKYLKELKQRNIYPLSYRKATKETKRKLQIINFSPSMYCWLIYMKNYRK